MGYANTACILQTDTAHQSHTHQVHRKAGPLLLAAQHADRLSLQPPQLAQAVGSMGTAGVVLLAPQLSHAARLLPRGCPSAGAACWPSAACTHCRGCANHQVCMVWWWRGVGWGGGGAWRQVAHRPL